MKGSIRGEIKLEVLEPHEHRQDDGPRSRRTAARRSARSATQSGFMRLTQITFRVVVLNGRERWRHFRGAPRTGTPLTGAAPIGVAHVGQVGRVGAARRNSNCSSLVFCAVVTLTAQQTPRLGTVDFPELRQRRGAGRLPARGSVAAQLRLRRRHRSVSLGPEDRSELRARILGRSRCRSASRSGSSRSPRRRERRSRGLAQPQPSRAAKARDTPRASVSRRGRGLVGSRRHSDAGRRPTRRHGESSRPRIPSDDEAQTFYALALLGTLPRGDASLPLRQQAGADCRATCSRAIPVTLAPPITSSTPTTT